MSFLKRFFVTLLLAVVTSIASAAPYTWDASGGAPLDDGAGTWNTTGTNWFDGTTYVAWGNTTSDVALFGVGNGAAGTITVSSVTLNGITFNNAGSGNYTLTIGTLAFGGTNPTVTVNASGTSTISSGITGSAGLIKDGSGSLMLSGAGVLYTGTTAVNNGTMIFRDTTGGVVAGANGFKSRIAVSPGATIVSQRTVAGSGNRAAILGSANSGSSDPWVTGTGVLNIDNAANTAGTADGGWTILLGGNAFTMSGTVNVNSGVLSRDGNVANVFNTTATFNVASGAVFGAARYGNSIIGALNGSGNVASLGMVGGTLTVGNGGRSGTFSGGLWGSATGADFSLTAGTLSLTKTGAGTQVLSGSSSYAGTTTVSAGILNIRNANALGSTNAGTTVSANAALELQGDIAMGTEALTLSGTGTGGGALRNISGNNSYAGSITLAAAARINSDSDTLTLSNAGTLTGAFGLTFGGAGNITIDRVIATGANSVTKDGVGRLTLSASSSYTGSTAISGGRLEIGSAGQINGTSGITINGAGAELKYNSATALTQPITFTAGTLSGTGTIGTAVTAGANDILSPGNSPGSQSFTSGLAWDPAGTYLWEMNNATGGSGTGWDIINVSGGSGLTINATSGTTFKIAITSLSGTAAGNAANFSATTSGSWTILSSASGITGFAANKFTLDRSAFTNTSSGSFTLSQVASGTNQTLVLAYNTLSALSSSTSSVTGFRVMQNQSTTTSGNLLNAGPDATGYSLSTSAALSLVSGSTGTLAASGTQAITFGYASTATTGVRSGTVSFTNTGNSGDAGGSVSVSGAVVTNRVVTASDANFGVVHLGASGTATSNFTSTGSDNDFTRITVANGSGGGLTVSGSSGFVFDGSGGSSRSVAGTFATAGVLSGTISLTNASAEAAGLLPGQVPGTTSLAYSASVFSGTATWNVVGGGSWGSGASSSWTSTGGVQAAPGTFADYTNTDAAIFAGTQGGTSTVLLNGATPSLAAISFTNKAGRYVIDQGSGGSLTLAAASVKPTIDVVAGGLHEIKTAITGSSGLNKIGVGTLVLSGSSNYSGGTDITAGTIAVNGAIGGAVNVANAATLGGSGLISGAITGAGLVSPGNSPGILTAAQFDPSGALDAAFEFTGLSPAYASASASVNDVIRLTDGSNPFASGAFTSANVIDVYFNVDSITSGQVYEGGFFTGLSAASLLAALDGTATFNYWAKTTGTPTRSFGGFDYVSLTSLPGITGVTFQTSARTADFGSGSVNGSVTQFVIVPEPAAVALAGIGVAAAAWAARRRQRR